MKQSTVGFVNGCYDLLHDGHVQMLTECAENCDHLIVAVNSDRYCRSKKGKDRPVDPWWVRASKIHQVLTELKEASFAIIPFEGDDQGLLMHIRPDILFKGYDHSPLPIFYRRIGWKKLPGDVPAFQGPKIHHCKHLPGFSTTSIVEQQNAKAEGIVSDAQDLPG
jgi:D-beta-D-heptose 7-phosphate kinase/D-beta-D-heptose 1-phosphate adenosyltransferase